MVTSSLVNELSNYKIIYKVHLTYNIFIRHKYK